MAAPVLLISSDPLLGASLEALAGGRIQVARLDPARRPAAWPGEPSASVVLDVTARRRTALHAWVRRYHRGPLVVLLKPGERVRTPALDPATVVVGRPFLLADLVRLLERPPAPLPDLEPAPWAAPPTDRPAARPDGRRRRRSRVARRLAARVLVGVLVVLLVLAGVWLALGLVERGREAPLGAAGAGVAVARIGTPVTGAALDLRG